MEDTATEDVTESEEDADVAAEDAGAEETAEVNEATEAADADSVVEEVSGSADEAVAALLAGRLLFYCSDNLEF